MPEPCPHTGEHTRKFGGDIVCEDCTTVIGNWRTDPPIALTVTMEPDGTLRVDGAQ